MTILSKFASRLVLIAVASMGLGLNVGCQPEGPAERAGEAIDQGARNVKDAVTPAGPGEKAGEAVDNALGK